MQDRPNSSPAAQAHPRRETGRAALAFILIVVMLDMIGFSMLFPVNAYIVREYNTDALAVTLLTVIFAAGQFTATPVLGRLSDLYGRRPVLLTCVAGSAIGYFMFGVGGALWAGVAYDHISPGSPFWTTAILLLGAWIVLARTRPSHLAR